MCCIEDASYSWQNGLKHREIIAGIIQATNGWKAAAADIDMPELEDGDNLEQWVELIKPEVIVKDFWTGNHDCRYVAHTTPKLCAKMGVEWDKAEAAMDAEIQMFNQWCEGDTWGVTVSEAEIKQDGDGVDLDLDEYEDEDWVEVDSCWGFYTLDTDNGMRDHVDEEHWDKLDHALNNPTY
jgi:hypothetical protein